MQNLPAYISIIFALTTILTAWIFYKASNNSRTSLIILLVWLGIQTKIGLSNFYTVTNTFPPRFFLAVAPPLLFIIILFITKKGRRFIDSLNIKMLTILHTIRILVEVVIFWLFVNKAVPKIMTFEGYNFDIVSGLTAPLIYYFGFMRKQLNSKIILLWNIICLGLLINIIILAVLSAPFTFQKFGV